MNTIALLAFIVWAVLAGEVEQGASAYLQNCAACHGNDGKGKGPTSVKLRTKPADLTVLAKRNNGVYARDQMGLGERA